MKTLILISSLVISSSIFASCYKYTNKDTRISWVAYKTPAKAPVGGEFKKFSINTLKQQGSLDEVLTGATFNIDTSSVHTKNASRDKKIVTNFFPNIEIKGVVRSIKKNSVHTEMIMNGKKVKVPLKMNIENNELKLDGDIDVLDFMMSKNLAAINKACFALHEGKTWGHVKIQLATKLENCN